jgi:glycosyltransferase involved in cell wall biosynthesis
MSSTRPVQLLETEPLTECPRMRIVHVVQSLEIGGLERMVVDLAAEQRRCGHDVKIYAVYRRGAFADEAERRGIPVVCFGKTDGVSPGTLWRMLRALRQYGPDVVHTHNTVVHHYGALAAKLAGVRTVVTTQHHLGAAVRRQTKARRIFDATLPFTQGVVTVSECTRAELASWCGINSENVHVILNGTPLQRFLQHRATPGSAPPRIHFGAVGRLAEQKDHATLVQAFGLVADVLPHSELSVLGEGPLRATLEELVRELGLQKRIRFRGASSDAAKFLSELDVFVLSSRSEGLPIVILEAMAVGLPIVSTRVGGTPEVAPEGEVAWYCPPASPRALAETMLQVSRRPDLSKIGEEANRIAVERFSIGNMASAYEECYQKCRTRRQGSFSRNLPPTQRDNRRTPA